MICSDVLNLCNASQGGALETSDSFATGDFRLPKILGKPIKRQLTTKKKKKKSGFH